MTLKRKRLFRFQSYLTYLFCLVAICFICAVAARAQIETGTIVGTVTDTGAAIVPGVKVEIATDSDCG